MHQFKRSTNERVLARHHDLMARLPAFEDDLHALDGNDLAAAADPDPANPPHAVVRTSPVPPAKAAAPPPTPVTPPAPALTPPLPKVPFSSAAAPPPVQPTPVSPAPPVIQTVVTSSVPVVTSTPLTTSTPTPTIASTTANRVVASGTAAPETSATSTTSSTSAKGISGGAIGGLVAVLVVLALLVSAFFVRKIYQRRRAMKRNTWGAGLMPSLENKRQNMQEKPSHSYGGAPPPERFTNLHPSGMLSVPPALATPSTAKHSSAYPAHASSGINLPVSAYNAGPSTAPGSPITALSPGMNGVSPAPIGELAVVARTFIPSLPDELHISNAEQIRILSAYDDGWALCANARGEQGVVPLECLDRSGGAPTEMQLQPHSGITAESNKTSRRMSSLAPAAPGTY